MSPRFLFPSLAPFSRFPVRCRGPVGLFNDDDSCDWISRLWAVFFTDADYCVLRWPRGSPPNKTVETDANYDSRKTQWSGRRNPGAMFAFQNGFPRVYV